MKIKGVTRQWEGGGYYRMRQPIAELGKHGHETSCTMAKSDVEFDGEDVIVGQVIGGDIAKSWWRGLSFNSRLVYELDDDLFNIERINPMHSLYSDPEALDSMAFCMQMSDLVTCTTEVLAERMRKYNPNVATMECRIDEQVLGFERPQRDRLVIGWAGGDSHMRDMGECVYGLRKVLDRNPQCEAHFIGADLRFLVKRPVRYTEWVRNTIYYCKLIDFDIALIPLADTYFNQAKSHSKALEMAALGIPVIASDVEPYSKFVVDGVTGFLVRSEWDWARKMRELINDEAMRTEMGAKAKELASQWTIQKGWQDWESAYQGILK